MNFLNNKTTVFILFDAIATFQSTLNDYEIENYL